MGSNNAQTGRNRTEVKEKLDLILESAEAQHPFSKKNYVFMRKLVFLWIVGNDNQIVQYLKSEIQSIVEDRRSIWIIHSDPSDITDKDIYHKIYEGIECASTNYLGVDMDHLMVCPILLKGCFEQKENAEHFTQAAVYVQEEMKKRHRYIEWSPFVLTSDEDIDMTRNQIQFSVQFMERIMEEGRKAFLDCCCPACVISDVNEIGQAISIEQAAKIIVMLTVFRNTSCENEDTLASIMMPVQEYEREYFFSARAVSICEPVKSLMLNRLLAVHRCFQNGLFPQQKLFDNLEHSFFEGKEWKEQLDKVAHDQNYTVLTESIYSNIPLADNRMYEQMLRKFCQKYYFEPLSEEREQLLKKWWKSFLEEFFLHLAGSMESLDKIEENREKIIDKVPKLNINSPQNKFINDMRKSCEAWLINELRVFPQKMVEEAMKPEGIYVRAFRQNKEFLQDIFQKMEDAMQREIKRLQQTELLLNTGGGHISNAQDEAEHWFQDYKNTVPTKVKEVYKDYQTILCRMFQSNENHTGTMSGNLLENYSKIVSGSIESREAYMKKNLTNLAASDMEQLLTKLEQNWRYPLRMIGSVDQNKEQKLYVMGNRDNYLCRRIREQEGHYQIAFKECPLDDRLEIVRVSDRMTEGQIITKEQESEKVEL